MLSAQSPKLLSLGVKIQIILLNCAMRLYEMGILYYCFVPVGKDVNQPQGMPPKL